MTLQRKSSR